MYAAMRCPRRYSYAVSTIELDDFIQEFDTCGDASGSIIEGTSGANGASICSGPVCIASGSMNGDAGGIPLFSSNPEFFKSLRKNYQWVKTEKLRSLQEF
ncbi:hypothetical protein AXG93_4525s1040 [Marchantia polymorpha subsp. ruderalis]|uniref:Uncharacterized protein n=1 Tax=Marchantia polymorpha subsp. ruderalis TaxID=1480154 RepID=A0A176WHX3_MARPO|nr:hypothetical protein AXG93_4525s1040 [Marchantia polymorpha subsp. ruderalis]